jgi:hypothetical protein
VTCDDDGRRLLHLSIIVDVMRIVAATRRVILRLHRHHFGSACSSRVFIHQ